MGRTKAIKTYFYVNCLESLTVIPHDLILGIPRAQQLCPTSPLGDPMSSIRIPCCCICWFLQIVFALVFVDFVSLDLVTHFYLICLFLFFALGVVCHSRINTEPPAPGAMHCVPPPECANICSRAASEPRDVSSDTRRCSPGQGQGQRV